MAFLPQDRPADGVLLQAELSQIQARRTFAQERRREIFLWLAAPVERVVIDSLSLQPGEVAPFVLEDLQEASGLYFDEQARPEGPDLMIAAGSFLYRCRCHASRAGVLAVINASRLSPTILERLRADALRAPLDFRITDPTSPGLAQQLLDDLYVEVAQSVAERLARREQEREQEAFRVWRSILEAKRQIENERGVPVRYRGFRVEGNRIVFELDGPAPEGIVDETRLVRNGQQVVLAGEVEDATEGHIHLFLTRGGRPTFATEEYLSTTANSLAQLSSVKSAH